VSRKNHANFLYKLIIPVLIFIIMGAPNALGTNSIKTKFLTAYPTAVGSRLATLPSATNHCGTCHYAFSSADADIPNLNPYGLAVQSGGFGSAAAIAAIGSQDSDSDGFTNDEEINGTGFTNIPTFPGLKSSNVSNVSGVTVSQITGFLTPVLATPNGSLQVTLGPAGAITAGVQWSVDGGAWQNSAATVTGLSVGSHAVTYKAVTGWTAPTGESASITDGVTTTISRTYTQQIGSLQVTLGPVDAVTAGAQWNVDGGAWQNSAATVTGLSVGSHAVTYKAVTGWTAPAGESAAITNGGTTAISRTYTQQTGSLKVTINPAAARTAGAQWNVDGGAWQNSAATVTGLSVGSHAVTYKTVAGWTAPASESASITNGVTTAISRTYTVQTQSGNLQVTLDPAGAVTAGAQWRVDGGAFQNSGATVTGLSVGSHTVNYKTVALWTAPVDESVSITDSNTTAISGTYTLTPVGSLQVTLDPNEAVAAGAQWSVDGGTFQNSGATVTGLSVGSHPVTYKSVTGWTAPAGESAIITDGNTTAISRTYILLPQSGSLKVTLGPSGAVGAQWSVDGGAWQNSAAMVTGLSVGSHTVSYKAVTGWTAPASGSVSITNGVTTTISGTYTLAPLGRVILVYQTTLKVSPAASRDSESEGWQTGTVSAKAYMVIDVNLSDPNVDNIQAALIPYGKSPAGTKAYVDDANAEIFGFSILPGFETSPTKLKPDVWVFDFTANNAAAERAGMGIVDARMQGTVKVTDVSPTETGNVATSPKGVAIEDSLYDDTLAGSGTFAAKLDSKNTNRANDPAVWNGDFDAVVTGLKQILGDQGYIPVTQTP
jgi:hypothetical protein